MEIKPGYYPDLDAIAYHSSHAISSSALVHALRSPAHFWAHYVGNPKRVTPNETPALNFGRAAHVAMLETERFEHLYRVAPEGIDRRTKAGKEAWAVFLAECTRTGAEIVSHDDMVTIVGMAHALDEFELEDPFTGTVIPLEKVFSKGKAEESFFWTDPETGLPLRARSDWRIGNIVVDYKTARDARPMPFRKEVAMRRYYMRAAMYLDGIEACTGERPEAFFLLAQEKEAPFAAAAYQINPDDLEFGRQQYKAALVSLKRGFETGKWAGYSRQVEVITVPDYLRDETVQ